jgi:hypothetical protein
MEAQMRAEPEPRSSWFVDVAWRLWWKVWMLGLIAAIGGGISAYTSIQALSGTVAADGTVIGLQRGNSEGTTGIKVRYEADGKTHEITSDSRWNYKLGEKVTVRYPSERPHSGSLATFKELWICPSIGFVGLLIVLVLSVSAAKERG